MNKEQFDKKYVGHKKVVHCDTHEKAKKLLAMADKFGYRWCNKKSYLEVDDYKTYSGETCYYIYNGSYGNTTYFNSYDYTIIEYTEDTMTKDDLRLGDRLVKRNGKIARYVPLESDLTCAENHDDDIIEAYRDGECIYRRKETITMTPDEALAELQRLTGKKIVMKEKSE